MKAGDMIMIKKNGDLMPKYLSAGISSQFEDISLGCKISEDTILTWSII